MAKKNTTFESKWQNYRGSMHAQAPHTMVTQSLAAISRGVKCHMPLVRLATTCAATVDLSFVFGSVPCINSLAQVI